MAKIEFIRERLTWPSFVQGFRDFKAAWAACFAIPPNEVKERRVVTPEEKNLLDWAARNSCSLCSRQLSEFDDYTGRFYHRDQHGQFYNGGYCDANKVRFRAEGL